MHHYEIQTIVDLYPIDIKPFKDFAVGDYLSKDGCFYQKTAYNKLTSMRTGLEIEVSDFDMKFSTTLSFAHGGFTYE